jgi:uncharacterized membrane protein (UPF0127 family)
MTTFRLVTFALASTLFGCEPRIEEPVPPSRDVRPDVASSPDKAAPTVPVKPARCVFPTPDKPMRTLAHPGPDPNCPADPEVPPNLRSGKVRFVGAKDKPVEIVAEVAERPRDRARGLMFRTNMPEDHGMIFVFNEQPEVHEFWMRNTCIPLDMLFVDRDGVIVGIVENIPTMNDSTYSVPCPSSYVIEVNAGYCRRHGIVAGQKIQLDGV